MANDTSTSTVDVAKQDPHMSKLVMWIIAICALFTYLIIAYVAAYAPDHHKVITGPLIPLREIMMTMMVISFALGLSLHKLIPKLSRIESDPNGYALFILRLLFHFGAAMFGFLFTMLSFQIEYTVIGWLLGLIGMMLMLPKKREFENS